MQNNNFVFSTTLILLNIFGFPFLIPFPVLCRWRWQVWDPCGRLLLRGGHLLYLRRAVVFLGSDKDRTTAKDAGAELAGSATEWISGRRWGGRQRAQQPFGQWSSQTVAHNDVDSAQGTKEPQLARGAKGGGSNDNQRSPRIALILLSPPTTKTTTTTDNSTKRVVYSRFSAAINYKYFCNKYLSTRV